MIAGGESVRAGALHSSKLDSIAIQEEQSMESASRPDDVQAAWAEKIERRVAAFDRGEMPTYAADDVFAEAYARSRCESHGRID